MFNTLRDAVILVAFVVLLFLQNWRSALIPLVAVPVAIVGTFAVMAAIGFSLEQPDAFRAGAGHRHRGRRRDRGGRGGRAPHRARPGPARGHHHGDEPGLVAGDRGRTGAHGRVRPLRVHHGDHRPVLPAVRLDDRHLDGDLGVQLADAQPGPVGALASAAAEGGLPGAALAGLRGGREAGLGYALLGPNCSKPGRDCRLPPHWLPAYFIPSQCAGLAGLAVGAWSV